MHAASGLVLRRLVSRFAGDIVAYGVAGIFLFTTVYEEILAWPAHYREQCFILFLFAWLWLSARVFAGEGGRFSVPLAAGAFALMGVSYANVWFALIVLALFALAFHRALLLERRYALALGGVAVALVALHFALFAAPLAAQTATQNADLLVVTPERIAGAFAGLVRFTHEGVLAPVTRVGPWPLANAIAAAAAVLATLAGLALALRRKPALAPVAAFFLLCAGVVTAMQVWYRPDIAFLLNWTKYSFFPVALLLPVLAVAAVGLGARGGAALVGALLAVALVGHGAADRRDFVGLGRDARVMELVSGFDAAFATQLPVPALPDLHFPWNVFIPEEAPTLATVWRAAPVTRDRRMTFFDPVAPGGAERLQATLTALPADTPAGAFLRRYLPRTERPSAGDGGLSAQLAGDAVFVQELLVDEPRAFLSEVSPVAGTGGGVSAARIVVELLDEKGEPLFSREIAARDLNNNVATPIATPAIPVTAGRFFLVLRAAASSGPPPVVFYLTREPFPHLGGAWACSAPQGQPLALRRCITAANRQPLAFGAGFATTAVPVR
jgi:hypothetical protein